MGDDLLFFNFFLLEESGGGGAGAAAIGPFESYRIGRLRYQDLIKQTARTAAIFACNFFIGRNNRNETRSRFPRNGGSLPHRGVGFFFIPSDSLQEKKTKKPKDFFNEDQVGILVGLGRGNQWG